MPFVLDAPISFEPTTVGIGSVIVAIVGGIVAFLVRNYVDKPRNDVLRQDVNDLMKSRDEARKERDRLQLDVEHARAEATAAKELATNRAKVDELFNYIKEQVETGRAQQTAFIDRMSKIAVDVEEQRQLRMKTLEAIAAAEHAALERHEEEMRMHREHADRVTAEHLKQLAVLTRIADAFDVKTNGGGSDR